MNVGKVVRPRESLGTALAAGSKPLWPKPRRGDAVNHWKTGKPMGAPTYHKGHPTLGSANVTAALPVRSTQGVSSTALQQYMKALQNGR